MSLRLRLGALALSLICAAGAVAADELTLNLRDTNISNLIDLVSEETGTNFIVDPRVRGNITVISSRPVPRDELMDLFHDILKIHGFAAIPGESSTRIVPDAQAKMDAPAILDLEPEMDADVRGGSVVTHVIALRHVAAAQLVPVLRPLIPAGGHLAAATEPNTLLISDTRSNVHRIRALVERMDLPFADDFEVIELRHARAGELAEQLQILAREGTGELATPQVLADRRSNAIILSGREESRLRLRGLIAQLDREMEEGNARVHYLKYARAEEVAELLRNIAEKSPDVDPDARSGSGIHIEAHEATNAVVTFGPSDFIRDFDIIVEQLDIRRAQVLVEAVIAEVSSDRVRDLGVQWGAIGNSGVGVLNFSGPGSRGILELAAGVEGFLDGTVSSPPDIGDGLTAGGVGSTGSTRIAALVNMLQRDTSSNILSTPSLLTLDNEEAEIVVGQNVPFIVGRSIEDSGQAFDTIRREDVGVKLRVRPQINQGNAVRLEIEQEVSQLAPGTSDAADLITNTRTLKTHVLIDDGDMLVLGGLIQEQQTDSEARVPGLGSIPGIGRLFRADRNQTEKRNLMVFLHPRIVRDSARGAELTSEKYSFIRGEQLREQARTQQRASPVLPEWERLTQLPPSFEDVHGHRD
ncbi:general secretion pathway protein GspD [Thioalkalivibrio versutus]|uniref:General secretion pathway protein GspD n=1 Tax=Thioalkalivibrio versutus TaxID=106634 RepID=A0A0G3G3V5_9GAMM|nr:type II secretion system secretin GspD [Thioalkalivibrio versutus]AKJ94162.1 general secretion pathway protein GspD [Thioalkalivibrio versutus]